MALWSSIDTLSTAHDQTAVRQWLAVAAVAMGTFLVVTVENLPMGLLTGIASGLGVSNGAAGLMVTAPGLVAAASAPLLTVAIRSLDRKIVLLGLVGLLSVCNVIASVTTCYAVVLVVRLLVGIRFGGF